VSELVALDVADVDFICINEVRAELSRLVADGDEISVVYQYDEHVASSVEDVFAQARAYIVGLESQVESLRDRVAELENAEPECSIAVFGRLDGQLQTIEADGDETIQDILDECGDLGEFETVFYNGHPVDEDDLDEVYVQAGDSILIVPTTKNGRRVKFLIEE